MILVTLPLGSRNYFLSESLLLQMIACCARRFRRYSRMFSRDTCAHRLCKFPTTVISLWITAYTCHSYIQSHWSCYYKMPRTALRCSENPLSLLPCSSLSPEYTYKLILTHPPRICFSPVVHVFHQSLRNTIWSFENPQQPVVLEILACLHYG